MLPVSGKKIFSSRWWALVYAAGIMWTAVEVADRAPKSGEPANSAEPDGDMQKVADAFSNI